MAAITLREYLNDHPHVVVVRSTQGDPVDRSEPIHESWFPADDEIVDLLGEIDSDGDWRWLADSDARDSDGNPYLWIVASNDLDEWAPLIVDTMADAEPVSKVREHLADTFEGRERAALESYLEATYPSDDACEVD